MSNLVMTSMDRDGSRRPVLAIMQKHPCRFAYGVPGREDSCPLQMGFDLLSYGGGNTPLTRVASTSPFFNGQNGRAFVRTIDKDGDGIDTLVGYSSSTLSADWNGDGLIDSEAGLGTGLDGSAWIETYKSERGDKSVSHRLRMFDFDGDGRADILDLAPDGGSGMAVGALGASGPLAVTGGGTVARARPSATPRLVGWQHAFANSPVENSYCLASDMDCGDARFLSGSGCQVTFFPGKFSTVGIGAQRPCAPNPAVPDSDFKSLRDSPKPPQIRSSDFIFNFHGIQALPRETDAAGDGKYPMTQVLDWNGDGLMDIVSVDEGTRSLSLYIREGRKADLLVSATDARGSDVAVTYRAMSDPAVDAPATTRTYEPGPEAECVYPFRCAKTGMWLVRTVSNSTAATVGPGSDTYVYSYKDARSDMLGGGSLGFKERRVARSMNFTDTDTATTTDFTEERTSLAEHTFVFDTMPSTPPQSIQGQYPLAGLVTKVITERRNSTGVLSRSEQVVTPEILRGVPGTGASAAGNYLLSGVNVISHQLNWQVHFTHAVHMDARVFEGAASQPKTRTLTTNWKDSYGNNTLEEVTVWTRESATAAESAVSQVTVTRDFGPGLSTFDEGRFLGLWSRTTTDTTYKSVAQPRRTVDQTFNARLARLDSTEVEPDGTADEHLTKTFTYNSYGQVTGSTTSGSGQERTSRTDYDASESIYPERVTNGLGHTVQTIYVPWLDQPAWQRDPNGIVTRWRYDGFGRVILVDGPGGADVATKYDSNNGTLTTVTGGKKVASYFDPLGRPTWTDVDGITAQGSPGWITKEHLFYDALGRVVRKTGPYGTVRVAFDNLGRTKFEEREDPATFAGWARTSYRYDNYLKTSVIDEAVGREAYTITDGLGQVVKKGEKNGSTFREVTYDWKAPGLLKTVVHGKLPIGGDVATTMDYDRFGRQTTLTSPDTGTAVTAYNAFGEVRRVQDAAGRVSVFDQDEIGRTWRRSDGTVDAEGMDELNSKKTTFYFDTAPNGIGKLGQAMSPDDVLTTVAYEDVFGKVKRKEILLPGEAKALGVSYVTDLYGRSFSVEYPAGTNGPQSAPFAATMAYSPVDGSPTGVTSPLAWWSSGLRDALGRLLSEGIGETVRTRQYDPKSGRMTKLEAKKGQTLLQSLDFVYQANGAIQFRMDAKNGLNEEFSYDPLDRLESWHEVGEDFEPLEGGFEVGFEYDDLGNLRRRSTTSRHGEEDIVYNYNRVKGGGPHAVTSSNLWVDEMGAPDELEYDATGNVTRHPGVGTITYTPFNLPKTVTLYAGGTVSYLYDAFGSRVKKVSNGSETVYVDGIYERRKATNVPVTSPTVTHVFYLVAETGVFAQVTASNAAGTPDTRYIIGDNLGSTAVINGATQTYESRDPFGNRITFRDAPDDVAAWEVRIGGSVPVASLPGDVTRGYTGHEEERDLGLVNMQGRIYDPRLGRMLQADPIVQAPYLSQSWNRYSYAMNNPTRYIDPTGYALVGDSPPDGITCQQNQCSNDDGDPYYRTEPDEYGNVYYERLGGYQYHNDVMNAFQAMGDSGCSMAICARLGLSNANAEAHAAYGGGGGGTAQQTAEAKAAAQGGKASVAYGTGPVIGEVGALSKGQQQKLNDAIGIAMALSRDSNFIEVFRKTVGTLSGEKLPREVYASSLNRMTINIAEASKDPRVRAELRAEIAAVAKDPTYRAPPAFQIGDQVFLRAILIDSSARDIAAQIMHEAAHLAGAPGDYLAEIALNAIHNASGLPR